MLNAKPAGTESNTFNITNDFRQITLLRNPLRVSDSASDGSLFTASSLKVNRIMQMTAAKSTTGFAVDEKITGGTSGATAIIDEVGDSNGSKIIRIHQNEKTVNQRFIDGESITGSASGSGTIEFSYQRIANGNISGVDGFPSTAANGTYGAIDRFSGDLLYLENRARIVRSSAQTEDIKVIFTV